MIDRRRDAASEGITRVVGHAGEIKRPEAGAHNERMPRSGCFRQRKRDRSAGRRLLAERSPLDHTYGLCKSASWIESSSESKEREEKKSGSGASVRCVRIQFAVPTPLTTEPLAPLVRPPVRKKSGHARAGQIATTANPVRL